MNGGLGSIFFVKANICEMDHQSEENPVTLGFAWSVLPTQRMWADDIWHQKPNLTGIYHRDEGHEDEADCTLQTVNTSRPTLGGGTVQWEAFRRESCCAAYLERNTAHESRPPSIIKPQTQFIGLLESWTIFNKNPAQCWAHNKLQLIYEVGEHLFVTSFEINNKYMDFQWKAAIETLREKAIKSLHCHYSVTMWAASGLGGVVILT